MVIERSYCENEPLRLRSGPQLLLDDVLVEDRIELKRVLHHPVRYSKNPILEGDKPWEGIAYRPQVIWDQEMKKFRMWYQCFNQEAYTLDNDASYYIGYAESDDGFNWEKPVSKEFPYAGHEATNIVYAGGAMIGDRKCGFSLGQAFLDENDPDPQRRYKMVGNDGRPHPRFPESVNTEPSIVCSPDGLHWQLSGDRPMLDHHSDTANHLVYDEVRGRWLLYCRPTVHASGLECNDLLRHPRRRVSVMTSPDLVNWSYPRTILYGDECDLVDIDYCHVFRYGSHFLMLYAAVDENVGRFHMRLASSSDGINWERFHTREDVLPLGSAGSWDAGMTSLSGPPILVGEKMLLYYIGGNLGQGESYHARQPRVMGGGVATMSADRFVSQRAGERTGYLITREFVLEGDALLLNMLSTGYAYHNSSLRVEVLRHPPLGEHSDYWFKDRNNSYAWEGFRFDDCVPMRCDSTRMPVRWKEKSLGKLRGKPIYLRFEMKNVDLFGFQIG